MILAVFWENPAIVGLIIAIPATALGYLGYRRSLGLDKVAEQAGIATTHANSIGQVVDGLNRVIIVLQEDNKILRGDIADLRQGVELVQARLDLVEAGNIDLEAKNRVLEREIVVLHAENEALKIENRDLKVRIGELEKANGP